MLKAPTLVQKAAETEPAFSNYSQSVFDEIPSSLALSSRVPIFNIVHFIQLAAVMAKL